MFLTEFTDDQLKAELRARGYATSSIWHTNDVLDKLNTMNEYAKEQDENFVAEEIDGQELLPILERALENDSYFDNAFDCIESEINAFLYNI